MARKRVNMKFLVILTAVVLIGGVGLVVARKVFTKAPKPATFITAADQAFAAKDYQLAAQNYRTALQLAPQDVPTLIKYGDTLRELTRTTPEAVAEVRKTWEAASEADPNNREATARLLQFAVEEAQVLSNVGAVKAENYDRITRLANKLLGLDPGNRAAQIALATAPIDAWIAAQATDETTITSSLTKLTELIAEDPGNAELPYAIARAKLRAMSDAKSTQEASQLVDDAIKAFDAGLAKFPDSEDLHFRLSQMLVIASAMDKSRSTELLAKSLAASAKALAAAKPDGVNFSEIYLVAAQLALQQGKMDDAQSVLRKLLAAHPEDQSARLMLGRLLASKPATRDEAIELLVSAPKPPTGYAGPRALATRERFLQGLLDLANMRLDALATVKDAPAREQLIKDVEGAYDELSKKAGDIPQILTLKGKLQLAQNQNVAAIQTLSRANALLRGDGKRDYDLMFLLARAYVATNQTGEAKNLLAEVVDKFPALVPPRVLLAQLMLAERAIDEARPHIDTLQKLAPNDADVIRLSMSILNPETEAGKLKESLSRLPEGTRNEKFQKAQTAVQVRDLDTAIRLCEAILAADPSDVGATQVLVRLHIAKKDKDKAIAVADAAIKVSPDNVNLKLLRSAIDDPSKANILPQVVEDIEKITNPVERELKLAQISFNDGKKDEGLAHLLAARKSDTDDAAAADALFNYYLSDRKLDDAAALLPVLSKANRDQAGGLLYQFRLQMARQDTDGALSTARELSNKLPEFAQSWLSLAQAFHARRDWDNAVKHYTTVLEKQPTNADAFRGIIECLSAMRRFDDARRYLAQARTTFPADGGFRDLELNYELRFGDPTKALPALEEVAKSNPDQASAAVQLAAAYLRTVQVKTQAGDEAGSKTYLGKAVTTLKAAAEKFPTDISIAPMLAESLLLSGDAAAAEKVLVDFTKRDDLKARPDPERLLGEFYTRLGRLDDAEKSFRAAVARDPKSISSEQQLAAYLAGRGKVDDALTVLKANAEDPAVMRQTIEIQINSGRPSDAEQSLLAAISKNPKDVGMHTLLAIVYLNTQRFEQADKELNDALQIEPKNLGAIYYRGLAQVQRPGGDLEAALRDLGTVRDADPLNTDARTTIAEVHRRRGDLDAAIRELEGALKANPVNQSVRIQLVNLCSQTVPPRWGDVERYLGDARSMPQIQNDPDWDVLETRMWIARGESKKATASAEAAYKRAPGNPGVLQTYLDVLLRGAAYGRVVQETDPLLNTPAGKAWWLHQFRGTAKARSGDRAGALVEFQSALELADASKNEDVARQVTTGIANEVGVDKALELIGTRLNTDFRWQRLAVYLYQAKGDYTQVIAYLDRMLETAESLAPADRDSVYRMAGTMFMTAKPAPLPQKAYDVYLRLLERAPNDLASLNNLAFLLVDQLNDPQKAKVYSQRAYEIMQKSGAVEPLLLDTHGWVLVQAGEVQEGINVLRDALERRPFVDAFYHLGLAYMKLPDQADAAVKQLKQALDLISQDEAAKRPFDPEFKKKIENALNEASDAAAAKSQTSTP